MEGESDVTRIIIDGLHSWDMQGDEMEDESGVTLKYHRGTSFFEDPRRSNRRWKWCSSKCD